MQRERQNRLEVLLSEYIIHKKDEKNDIIEIEADLTVGKKFLNQTYTSHVTYYKEKDNLIILSISQM